MALANLHIGGPAWSNKDWVGSCYRRSSKPAEFLGQYASIFNAVEGNSTFYALPKPETAARWLAETPSAFRFCFKVPRSISHDRLLQHIDRPLMDFLHWLEPLQERLGPCFLQLPPAFGPEHLQRLEDLLDRLPRAFSWAVEVRHSAFFQGPATSALDRMLGERAIDRVCFDTSVLHAIDDGGDEATRTAQSRKPRLPAYLAATGQQPFLRYCGHNAPDPNRHRFAELAGQVATWIKDGRRPFVFLHSPDDRQIPALIRCFVEQLESEDVHIGDLPSFPAESDPRQTTLF